MKNTIEGVSIQEVIRHADQRGYFSEIFHDGQFAQENNVIKQVSASLMYPGVIKAWHIHRLQYDWWYCVSGNLQVGLWDIRNKRYKNTLHLFHLDFHETNDDFLSVNVPEESLVIGENGANVRIEIPPGVAHGCKVIGNKPALLVYATSRLYDQKDELRLPHNHPSSPFNWTAQPAIK